MEKEFKLKSVLNTDRFDCRKYGELRSISTKMQEVEEEGTKTLPSFPHLLGDTWAGLFKLEPSLTAEEVKNEVRPHRAVLEQVLNNSEFQGLRAYTKLDELASALGAVQMGAQLTKLINEQEDVLKKMLEASEKQDEAEHFQAQADAQKDAAAMAQDEEKKQELQNTAKSNQQKAARRKKQAKKINQQAAQLLEYYLDSEAGKEQLEKVVMRASAETQGQTKAANNLISGLGWGSEPGDPQKMSVRERIELAETIQGNLNLRKVADLAGRMKRIAHKKQKSKTNQSVVNTSIAHGKDPSKLLPAEVANLRRPQTRQDFLMRFSEGKALQYAPSGKEKLGKGPIVVCLDTSSSMRSLDPEAKAVAIALAAAARKQNRAFALINFASSHEIRTWKFEKPKNIQPKDIIEMAQFFFDGGTDFNSPLKKAIKVMEESRFKKGDIIFITDGRCTVTEATLKTISKEKKKEDFSIISIQLNSNAGVRSLETFSDQIIQAQTLFESQAMDAIFSV